MDIGHKNPKELVFSKAQIEKKFLENEEKVSPMPPGEDKKVVKKDREEIRKRRAALVKVVKKEQVEKQERFIPLMKAEGYEVSQSTISRDLKVLAIDIDPKTGFYAVSDQTMIIQWKERLRDFVQDDLEEFVPDVRLLAVKTTPGLARTMAVAVERSYPKEVLGSITGEDLAIIVTRDEKSHKEISGQLASMQKRKKLHHS